MAAIPCKKLKMLPVISEEFKYGMFIFCVLTKTKVRTFYLTYLMFLLRSENAGYFYSDFKTF